MGGRGSLIRSRGMRAIAAGGRYTTPTWSCRGVGARPARSLVLSLPHRSVSRQRTLGKRGEQHASTGFGRDPNEQLLSARELRGVLLGQAGGALGVAGHDQRGDVNELTFAPRCLTGLLLRLEDVAIRSHGVAVVGSHHGEQDMLDGGHGRAPG